jgi:hypothetical protein
MNEVKLGADTRIDEPRNRSWRAKGGRVQSGDTRREQVRRTEWGGNLKAVALASRKSVPLLTYSPVALLMSYVAQNSWSLTLLI